MAEGDVTSGERGSGARYNDGKVPMELVPMEALEDIARVFGYGARKYASWNWAKGMKHSVPYACAMRHLAAWQRGEELDPESGLPHLAHVGCNILMLLHFARYCPDMDDRPRELSAAFHDGGGQ